MKCSMFIAMSVMTLALGATGLTFDAGSQIGQSALSADTAADQLLLARGGDDTCPRQGKGDECDDHVVSTAVDQLLLARGGDDAHPEDSCRHGACAADQPLLAKQGRGGHDDGPEPETPGAIS